MSGGSWRRSGHSERRRTWLGSPIGSGPGFHRSHPRVSAQAHFPHPGPRHRLLFPTLHAGASGTGATSASGRAGRRAARGCRGGGRGRHFRSGPRVSPERRRLLRLLGLLPAETPAPVSDGCVARGPGCSGGGGPRPGPLWSPERPPNPSKSVQLPPGPCQGTPNHCFPVRPLQIAPR